MLTILLILAAVLAVYLFVAFIVYKRLMPKNANAMQQSMSIFVVAMALAAGAGVQGVETCERKGGGP